MIPPPTEPRDELDAEVVATVEVIDVVAHSIKLYGSREKAEELLPPRLRPLPDHDYRFEVRFGAGGSVTFNQGATARDVAEHFKREGWLVAGEDR